MNMDVLFYRILYMKLISCLDIFCDWVSCSGFKLEARLLVAFAGHQQYRMKEEQRAKGRRFLEAATLHQHYLVA